MEPVNPLTTKQELKFKIPESPDGEDITISLVATDAGDGNESDYVIWQAPRLVVAGPAGFVVARRAQCDRSRSNRTATNSSPRRPRILNAADEISSSEKDARYRESCQPSTQSTKPTCEHGSITWASAPATRSKLEGLFTTKLTDVGGFEFVNGWGTNETPLAGCQFVETSTCGSRAI